MELLDNIFPAENFSLVPVILGLPAIGAFVNGVFGKRLGKDAVRLMALAAIGGAFLASLLAFVMLVAASKEGSEGVLQFKYTAWHWLDLSTNAGFGTASLDVAFVVDHLSAVMMLIITGVGFLIHLYASAYMWDDHRPDGGFHRFFAYLNLFCFAMLVLVMGASLPILFVGWEGVGLCSYLLIGFWYSEDANAAAGKKAFIANRIGDFGLLVGMALLLVYTGALDWEGIGAGAGSLLQHVQVWPIGQVPTTGLFGWIFSHLSFLFHPLNLTAATVIGLCLFLGCAGKSAQFPLYVWLPDAMAGPTPVSALIHAATMVTAGVYLVCRLSGVFLLSPFVMATIATVGAFTAFFAATIGITQTDIKKVLAYSTVSQLGFMFMGVGVGAFTAGFFHVFTHAFFKACLFLGAGSVIHAMHAGIHDDVAAQDMRNMGGLRRYMRTTYVTFLASCLAIAGFPLTSGFFSKDEILYRAYVNHIHAAGVEGAASRWEAPNWFGPAIYVVGVLAATMTAFYMFRALFLTFWGEFKGWKINPAAVVAHGGHHASHESESHAHQAAHGQHAHGADDHGHGGHDHGDHDHAAHDHGGHDHAAHEAPAPHESPWPMTVPLLVLGAFALVGGFLNPGLFSHHPAMEHWLAPLFELSEEYVKVRPNTPSEWALAIPGVLAGLGGIAAAYYVYIMSQGKPAHELTVKAPGLYRLVLDKWRIDELYDNTVIAMVESLSESAALFDKWVVDGLIARLTSLIVAATGSILRGFQTGVVHVYAAVMVVGLAALGWFFVWQPQAHAIAREQTPGKYVVEAAPGLGYEFRWHVRAENAPDSEAWSPKRTVEVDVPAGESKTIRVEVRNAFRRTGVGSIVLTHPGDTPAAHAALPTLKGAL